MSITNSILMSSIVAKFETSRTKEDWYSPNIQHDIKKWWKGDGRFIRISFDWTWASFQKIRMKRFSISVIAVLKRGIRETPQIFGKRILGSFFFIFSFDLGLALVFIYFYLFVHRSWCLHLRNSGPRGRFIYLECKFAKSDVQLSLL